MRGNISAGWKYGCILLLVTEWHPHYSCRLIRTVNETNLRGLENSVTKNCRDIIRENFTELGLKIFILFPPGVKLGFSRKGKNRLRVFGNRVLRCGPKIKEVNESEEAS